MSIKKKPQYIEVTVHGSKVQKFRGSKVQGFPDEIGIQGSPESGVRFFLLGGIGQVLGNITL